MKNRTLPNQLYTVRVQRDRLPSIGITMGDAAGIGPEIIVKALTNKNVYSICQPIVIGSPAIIQDALRFLQTTNGLCESQGIYERQLPKINTIKSPTHATATYGTIDVLDVSSLKPDTFSLGKIDAQCGTAAIKAIETAVQLTLKGNLDGITTAPICKASIQRAGSQFPAHTEMLAHLTQTQTAVMMLKTWHMPTLFEQGSTEAPKKEKKNGQTSTNHKENLTISFVTNHIPIAEVSQQLSVEKIVYVLQRTHDALVQFGIEKPRLVVAGLNPHAGEEGMFGKEEERIIKPAIHQIIQHEKINGINVDGPLPADTIFKRALSGEWDAVIAMYHDQGNIPIKLIGFGQVVNITLGLPIVRTSVDHGTAFDIAGKGTASETSLIAAIMAATELTGWTI